MIALRFWSFLNCVLILASSCTDSRAVPEDQLTDIDKDLASILNQADAPDTDTDSQIDKLDSVLSGFVAHPPAEESARDTSNRPETDRILTDAEDTKLDVSKLLDYLSKDENADMDVAGRFGSRLPQDNDDEESPEPIPKEILKQLESGGASSMESNDAIPKELLDSEDEKDERLAKALLDDLKQDPKENDDALPKELQDDLDESGPENNDEPIPRELLDDLKSGPPGSNYDEPIPRDLLDDLKSEKKDTAKHRECPLCKREARRGILMDELVSRMTTIVKRGDKIPRRMFEVWKKYRTKRGNTKRSDLMM